MAIQRSNCFSTHGHENPCQVSNNPYMIIFGVVEILLSQIPDFDQISWLSIVAAVMSFTYSTIGLGLGIAKVVGLFFTFHSLISAYYFIRLHFPHIKLALLLTTHFKFH